VRRVIIDSNAPDPFVDRPGAYEAAQAAIQRGDLEIRYVTHSLEEVAATPDIERRTRLVLFLTTLGKRVVSRGFILGQSRLGQAALSDDAGAAALEALGSGNLSRHGRDALAAAAAQGVVCAYSLATIGSRSGPMSLALRC
jgi:hypothetical protein